MKLNTKVVTGSVKLNYVNIKEARSNALSSEPKYSITIIIHKESNTMDKIYEGIYNATKNGLDIWGGKVPDNLITCLKDGDATGRKEYEDSFYINATSKYKPQVVDKDYQLICLMAKSQTIETSLNEGDNFYRKESFVGVINTGLTEHLDETLTFADIRKFLVAKYLTF